MILPHNDHSVFLYGPVNKVSSGAAAGEFIRDVIFCSIDPFFACQEQGEGKNQCSRCAYGLILYGGVQSPNKKNKNQEVTDSHVIPAAVDKQPDTQSKTETAYSDKGDTPEVFPFLLQRYRDKKREKQ